MSGNSRGFRDSENVTPAQDLKFAWPCSSKRGVQRYEQSSQIDKPGCSSSKHDHCDIESRNVLFARQVLVDRQEHVELWRCKREQCTIVHVLQPTCFPLLAS
jgi:hypothetical protein